MYNALNDVALIDGTTTEAYGLIITSDAPKLSIQLEIAEITAFTGTVTLWASNIKDAARDSDVGWIEMTTDHNFTGFVGLVAGALAGDVSAWADIDNANGGQYKVKIVRTAGSANPDCHVNVKKTR